MRPSGPTTMLASFPRAPKDGHLHVLVGWVVDELVKVVPKTHPVRLVVSAKHTTVKKSAGQNQVKGKNGPVATATGIVDYRRR